ncbi:MAG: gephyrin-like molybdotransferase Glp [Pyrinomonadaceae bacterium]
MIKISEALRIIERETTPLGAELVSLIDSVGRVLAEEVAADMDLPPFDRSQMDGYAVGSKDTQQVPATLEIVGESAAGHGWRKTLTAGQAVRIMTGAPVPECADAVQKLELASEVTVGKKELVEIRESVSPGQHIVRRASEIRKGDVALSSGTMITDNRVAMLAAFGYSKVKVGRRPRVTIMSTGSEVVEIDKTPGRDQIRNSNSVMLQALCQRAGALTTAGPIIKDEVELLRSAIAEIAEDTELLIITGGVSVGKHDHTKTVLEMLGAEVYFDKLALKPGKPAVFGRIGETLVFGLPGNPISAAVTFYLFVRKTILMMQNASANDLREGSAVLASDVKAPRERDACIPSRFDTDNNGRLIAHSVKFVGSSDFIGFGAADSLIFVPKNSKLAAGGVATIFYLN